MNIKNLSINKISLDNKKILLIMLACLIIVYMDFAFLLKLQFRAIRNISPKIVKLRDDINNLTKDLAQMQNLKDQPGKTGKMPMARAKIIISEQRIAQLLEQISDIANKNSIKIMKILPSKELKSKDEKTPVNTLKFKPILIHLDLSGNYHRLGSFINALEGAKELMAVENLKISRDPNNYFNQNVNVVLRTYVKK